MVLGVELDIDLKFGLELLELIVCECQIFKLVQSIRGVGNQLPQEDLLVGVKGMNDDIQKLRYLCFERMFRHLLLSSYTILFLYYLFSSYTLLCQIVVLTVFMGSI